MASSPPSCTATLEALGFCGADDSVNPRLLTLIGQKYPLVEWGILFRPDKEGQPRYATKGWVSRLSQIIKSSGARSGSDNQIRLAAHLCGSHVNDLLTSNTDSASANAIDEFLLQLHDWRFGRVQVNATAVNGVYTEKLGEGTTLQSFIRTTNAHPKLEFIVQKNDETKPLWNALLQHGELPQNVVFLHDESKGTGKEVTGGWPTESQFVATTRKTIGFAGGIKPSNVKNVALGAQQACTKSGGKQFWIDMESGVRTTTFNSDGTKEDIFDLSKCYNCIDTICEAGLTEHPAELR